MRLGQQAEKIQLVNFRIGGLPLGQALTHLDKPFFTVTLPGKYPTAQHTSPCQPKRKPLYGRKLNGRISTLMSCQSISAELMQPGSAAESPRAAKMMQRPVSQAQTLLT